MRFEPNTEMNPSDHTYVMIYENIRNGTGIFKGVICQKCKLQIQMYFKDNEEPFVNIRMVPTDPTNCPQIECVDCRKCPVPDHSHRPKFQSFMKEAISS